MRNPTEHAPTRCRPQQNRLSPFVLLVTLAVFSLSASSCKLLRRHGNAASDNATSAKFAAAHDSTFKYCPVESVRQPSEKSCGIAALASVMNYWEQDADVEALEKKYPAESENGYPLIQLRRIAIREGLIAFALTMKDRPLDQISEQLENGRPVITPVRLPRGRYFGRDLPVVGRLDATTVNPDKNLIGENWKHHYVVIFGQSDDQFLLMDPAYGIVKISKGEFISYWSAEKNAALLCSSF